MQGRSRQGTVSRISSVTRDDGFTIIELLVVLVMIGILAAIALPTFLRQTNKGQDASAEANARTLAVQIESCNLDQNGYTMPACEQPTNAGIPTDPYGTTVPAPGHVAVASAAPGGYTIVSASASGGLFVIARDPSTGLPSRWCTRPGQGSCPQSGVW
ncbi:MAG TPA: type II secretion system protein [Solirubrobacteraceae bacterium]|jgi:type IV pilus assembly protein PilA|nr:type II secretion system protein [Solirubrobacteraceae bacterium]